MGPPPVHPRLPEVVVTAATWITMIVIMGIIWGGFALAVSTAIRKESGKDA